MNDSRTLQELLEIVKKQEDMIALMETLQCENENLTRELEPFHQLGIRKSVHPQTIGAVRTVILFEGEIPDDLKSVLNNSHLNGWQCSSGAVILQDWSQCTTLNSKEKTGCALVAFEKDNHRQLVQLYLEDDGWRIVPLGENDTDYLFLPLHHTYAGVYNFYYSLVGGMQVYLCSDTPKIADELREVRPTIFCAVPLIYRRLMEAYGEHISMAFGDRIRFLFCGGANFSPKIRAFYKQHGLPMFEAYALTETSSSLSIEYPNFDDFESSGTVFENMEVKILNQDKDGVGDIVVKGESVFLGYLDDAKKTKAAFTDDGYFITGDYGWLEGNKLYVRGRKKDVLVGENGENVYLRGFGSFIIKTRAEKTGRNIGKNIAITIPAHKIPAFKPAKTFMTAVK